VLKYLNAPDVRDFEAKTIRIPIFLTGNDFTKLYSPLLRAGRMTKFKWLPSSEEKTNVIATIFQSHLTQSEAQSLIAHCDGLAKKQGIENVPVSFYASLKSRVLDDYILMTVQKNGWTNSYTMFSQKGVALSHKPTYKDYLDKADECVASLVNQSFLEGDKS